MPGLRRSFAFACTLFVTACTAESGPVDPPCAGAKCDDPGQAGDEAPLLTCWVNPGDGSFFSVDELHCRAPESAPVQLFRTSLQARTATGDVVSLTFEPAEAGATKVAPVRREDFPLDAVVSISIHFDDPLADIGIHALSFGFVIDAADSLPESEAQVVRFPLRAVPLELYAAAEVTDLGVEYEVDVSPFVIGSLLSIPPSDQDKHAISPIRSSLPFGHRRAETLWLGHEQTTVPLRATIDGQEHSEDIELPGALLLDANGIREIAPDDLGGEGLAIAECRNDSGSIFCRSLSAHTTVRAAVEGDGAPLLQGADSLVFDACGSGDASCADSPIALDLSGALSAEILGLGTVPSTDWTGSITLAAGETHVFRLPFELWTVELSTDGNVALIDLPEYELALGTLWPDRFRKHGGNESLQAEATSTAFAIAVPAATSALPCHLTHVGANGVTELDIELTPGSFIVKADGLESLPTP